MEHVAIYLSSYVVVPSLPGLDTSKNKNRTETFSFKELQRRILFLVSKLRDPNPKNFLRTRFLQLPLGRLVGLKVFISLNFTNVSVFFFVCMIKHRTYLTGQSLCILCKFLSFHCSGWNTLLCCLFTKCNYISKWISKRRVIILATKWLNCSTFNAILMILKIQWNHDGTGSFA